jgi:tRNA(Glu) U13 pseudouridine synthase TruD
VPSIFVFDERVNEKLILELRQYIIETIKFDHKIGISKLDGNAFVIRALTKMEEDGNALVVICVN